jgi:hypothetical protein
MRIWWWVTLIVGALALGSACFDDPPLVDPDCPGGGCPVVDSGAPPEPANSCDTVDCGGNGTCQRCDDDTVSDSCVADGIPGDSLRCVCDAGYLATWASLDYSYPTCARIVVAQSMTYLTDPEEDLIDSIPSRTPLGEHPMIDLIQVGYEIQEVNAQEARENWGTAYYECGTETEQGFVVCPTARGEVISAGEVLLVEQQFVADVPLADDTQSYVYALMFESNNRASDNLRFQEPYEWDYFQGTDRWYKLTWSHHSSEWSLEVEQLTSGQFPIPSSSSVRAVINGNSVTWFVSMSEFDASNPRFRVHSFSHDGERTEASRAGDVSGADPSEPLIPVRSL